MKILVVDDSKLARNRLIKSINEFSLKNIIIEEASDGIDAMEKYAKFRADIVVTDIEMPRMDGVELAIMLRGLNSTLEIIIVSSVANEQIMQKIKKDKRINFIKKPINIQKLKMFLLRTEQNTQLKEKN